MAFDFSKLSVLVVEDTLPMRKLIVSVLEALGVGAIMNAENGQRGFDMFQERRPDMVIADWHMEPVNGIELTKMIRHAPDRQVRMTPVILITGFSAVPRVAEARDAGVTEFLVKPFSAHDIARRIAYVINKPRDFVDTPTYFGPDRRRKGNSDYRGEGRRREDGKGE
jgi:CheY-like chemotaxis protein